MAKDAWALLYSARTSTNPSLTFLGYPDPARRYASVTHPSWVESDARVREVEREVLIDLLCSLVIT